MLKTAPDGGSFFVIFVRISNNTSFNEKDNLFIFGRSHIFDFCYGGIGKQAGPEFLYLFVYRSV